MGKVREASEVQQERQAGELRRKLNRDRKRCAELDVIIRKHYEFFATGRISGGRFDTLLAGYEQEQNGPGQPIAGADRPCLL